MEFVEQLKAGVDIVSVVGDYVRLRKTGAGRFTGLCPFHSEKTPSFSVNVAKQFYYCFGCRATGDVIKFVMELEGVSFHEALKSLAERYGIPMPKRSQYSDEDSRRRAALLEMHEIAQESFRSNLAGAAGEVARSYLARRGVSPETAAQFGLGYSLRTGNALGRLLEQRGFASKLIEESGLIGRRPEGSFYDRFRNRLMFPIQNEKGQVIAYGGRALADNDEPKYLNSPETPIYKKSHVLYNLHRAKDAIRKEDRTILVEGYMDAIGVSVAGFGPVVASCGTALTTQQIQMLRRHSQHIIVNFDPDTPGAAAAQRSIGMLLAEGMFVRIMELDGGLDPDEYCKEKGSEAYATRLKDAKGYFYWLADRARAQHDVRTSEGVVAVLQALLPAVQGIGDLVERMAVAEDLAGYVGVERGVVLDRFRKSVAERQEMTVQRQKEIVLPPETGLLNVLLSDLDGRESLIEELPEIKSLRRVTTRRIFQALLAVHAGAQLPDFHSVSARLEEADRHLLAEALLAAEGEGHEVSMAYGRECIASLRSLDRAEEQALRAELKMRIKQAERAGDVQQALRLAQELEELERTSRNRARGVAPV